MSPRSSAAELSALRDEVFARDGQACRWPGCDQYTGDDFNNPLQLCHLRHRGMGGSIEDNVASNCITLCRIHHDCLDGRTGLGTLRYELNEMLRAVVGVTIEGAT